MFFGLQLLGEQGKVTAQGERAEPAAPLGVEKRDELSSSSLLFRGWWPMR